MEESSADKSNWNILIKNIRRKFLDTVCENHENETLSRVIVYTEKEDYLLKTRGFFWIFSKQLFFKSF